MSRRVEILLVALVLAVIAAAVWQTWSRQQASRNWPSAEGRILAARIVESDDGSNNGEGSRRFTVEAEYEYRVAGRMHHGTRIRHAHAGHRLREEAETELARYPLGGRVEVFYDPARPEQSVLVQG